jgi:DNA invertase Pin-like site-specific DNA recombinase
MQRAALYHRVSTLDQNAGLARRELAQAAKARGLRVVLNVEETGSGARNDRPGLRRVLEAARKHQVEAVLVWKLDRFGRSVLDLVGNVTQLRAAGVRFVAVTQGIDLGRERDAASELQFNVLCAVAEYERQLIRERTRLGLASARAHGKRLGRPSKGPPTARVRELRSLGCSWATIAGELGCSIQQARTAAVGRSEA